MVQFIAEVSSNHSQSLTRCLAFIDIAAATGCTGVKFQLFRIEELFAPEILAKSAEHRNRKEWELPLSFLVPIAQRCREKGVLFSCTPFYLQAVEQLLPYIDFYKIASYELLWDDLLIACAETQKPVVLATGMASLEEVRHAVDILTKYNCIQVTLLHCVSAYPVPPEDCNLRAIETLRREFDLPAGWSDHSVSPKVINRAIHRFNAEMVEFHLDIDGKGAEFSAGHCWLPEKIKTTIQQSKKNSTTEWNHADGDGIKKPTASELPDLLWRADPKDGLRPFKSIRETFTP